MKLSERQVQRYGRQILLRAVGGAGQRALLGAPVRVRGEGPAFDAAVAYLAAGGSPLMDEGFAARRGFLAGAGSLADFNPDAGAPAGVTPLATLCGPDDEATLPAVRLGGRGLWLEAAPSCPACALLARRAIEGPVSPVDAVLLGAAAAVLVQRLVLELDEAPASRLLCLEPAGLTAGALPRCPAHAG